MKKETSYGIVPLQLYENAWRVLLIQQHAGHWGFPKGHPDLGETPKQTAKRELKEETGLEIERFLSPIPLIEHYSFTYHGKLISKTVQYFIALVTGNVMIQESEIKDSQWVSIDNALHFMTFKETRQMCMQVSGFLKSLDQSAQRSSIDQ